LGGGIFSTPVVGAFLTAAVFAFILAAAPAARADSSVGIEAFGGWQNLQLSTSSVANAIGSPASSAGPRQEAISDRPISASSDASGSSCCSQG
jgi:hypothetical protein